MYRRKMKCFFCKYEGEGKTLMKNALKLVKTRYKDVTQDDAFCNSCYNKIQSLLKRTIAKRRLTSTAISETSTMNNDTSSSYTSPRSHNTEDSLDRLLIEVERKNTSNQTTDSSSLSTIHTRPSIENNYWSMTISPIPQKRIRMAQIDDVPNVRPILPSDDDSVSISDEVPGPSSIANVQPLIRRRREPIIFTDEKIVPIYNRRHYGG